MCKFFAIRWFRPFFITSTVFIYFFINIVKVSTDINNFFFFFKLTILFNIDVKIFNFTLKFKYFLKTWIKGKKFDLLFRNISPKVLKPIQHQINLALKIFMKFVQINQMSRLKISIFYESVFFYNFIKYLEDLILICLGSSLDLFA